MTGPSPAAQVMQLLWPGAMGVQVVYVAARLRLAELVAGGPKSLEELAAATASHPESLGRLLRALCAFGLFAVAEEGRFAATPLGETLREDHPESVRPWAIFTGVPFLWQPWAALSEAIATGRPAFELAHGESFFSYLEHHPELAAMFNAAMGAGSSAAVRAILGAYDFSSFERIVDVGGGQGALLAGILGACPSVRGVLCDLPSVVAGAVPALRSPPLAERCEIVGCDFFTAVPAGGDGYLLRIVLHDWPDERAALILDRCRSAIRDGGRLLVIEPLATMSPTPGARDLRDLPLFLVGGRQRSEAQLGALLAGAGFSVTRVIPAGGPSIVESRPV